METQNEKKPKVVKVKNLGQGTHIFGAVHVHPNGDTTKQCVCLCPVQELGPKGTAKDSVEFTVDQFKFYDDEQMKQRVDAREYAVLVDGRDIRPEFAKREAAKAAAKLPTPPTESAASVESSVLADILAEGDEQKPE